MSGISEEITARLFAMQEENFADFQARLMPGIPRERIIGVKTPALREIAKSLSADACREFMYCLPHTYFEENNVHTFIINKMRTYDEAVAAVEAFLPYIDNWATCDQLRPRVFKRNTEKLMERIRVWLQSGHTYTVRFGIGMLMSCYLDDEFKPEYLEMAASVRSREYYVNMMTAWYFATALAKQYDSALPYIENRRLDVWTHNKAIQKAIESRRITDEQKRVLKAMKIK